MLSSLRIQLTLWYSLVLAAVLIVSAIVFYLLIEQAVKQVADDSLEDASDALIVRLKNADNSNDVIQEVLEDFRFQYTVFAIYDNNQKVIAASPRLEKDKRLKFPTFNISSEEIPPESLDRLIQSPNTHETFLLTSQTRIRMFVQPAQLDDRRVFIAALRPLTNQTELLSNIRFIAIAAIPLILLFASFAGYYIARQGLEPVLEMGTKALQITTQNLKARLREKGKSEELKTLARSFNQMLTRLEESFENQRRFMSDASHELRTPLVIVRGEAEVALQREGRTEAEYRESLDIIRKEGVRLSQIVDDLFFLARADAKQYMLNQTTFYLDELADECARAVRTLVSKKQVQFEMVSDEDLVFDGDEDLIRRLIIILLDNAIKYSDTNGTIDFKVRKDSSTYRIQVSNTGQPIREDEQEMIFDRFYRGDKVRSFRSDDELGTGSGLGLSIGAWIAEAHDGRLELASSSQESTIFIVTLPRK